MNPAVSPDGAWIVFASTRDRSLAETSLWIAKLGPESVPRRLTTGPAIDSFPAWTPDGRAIVFASTRGTGNFDLWTVPIAGGAPARLTDGSAHEVSPTVAPDGAIVYAVVSPDGTASRLEERARDGTVRPLTSGPDDRAPAVSPDGTAIAFTRRDGRDHDVELWTMPRDGAAEPARLVELPPTDESSPAWSRDGRYVFATSVLPGAENRPLWASIIFVDRHERPARARILRDRAGALTRLTPSIATATLDAPALRGDPEYLPELANIMAAAIAQQQRAQQPGDQP